MTLPIPTAALDDRLGFVGKTGSGKTYGASTAVERILAHKGRVVIPDALGVWWGLRQMADGEQPSPYEIVIFGGAHADLPLTPSAGAIVGETVAGMRESAIIDLSQFETAAAERKFMLALLDALYRKANDEPVHLIFDEADLWAPERILDKEGEATKLHSIMQTVVRRGRVKGLTSWLISQRPAALSKSVLSQVDGLVTFQLTASQDRKALGAWIEGQADQEEGKAILARLPTKKQGEAVVWLPARGILADVRFPAKVTYDSSRTPKRGEKLRHVDLKPLDVGRLRERLSTVEQEAKANDPRALKAEIARLQKQMRDAAALASKAGQTPDPAAIEAAEQRGYGRGEAEGYLRGKDEGGRHAAHTAMLRVVDALAGAAMLNGDADALHAAHERMKAIEVPAAKPPSRSTIPVARPAPQPNPKPPQIRQPSAANGTLGAERKPLMTLASAYPGGLTEAQWATIAGFKRTGGTWSTYKSRLRGTRMIEQRGALWHATEAALAVLGDVPPAPSTPEERVAMWKAALGSGPSKILDHLVDAYPDAVSRNELAAAVEMTASGGTFSTYLSRLSGNGLIERSAGALRASEALFA